MTSVAGHIRTRPGRVTRRLVCTVVVVTAVGVVAIVHAAAAPRDSGDAASLIDAARNAVAGSSFTGVVAVRWMVAGRTREERVPVTDRGGVLALGSPLRVMDTGSASLVHEADGWFGLSDGGSTGALPDPADHYDLSAGPGPTIAGRRTTLVTAFSRADRAVQERFSFDDATGILLRREQLDGARVERSVGFVQISGLVAAKGSAGAPPAGAHTAARVSTKQLPRGWDAPRSLRDGFELVDMYRQHDGSMQLYYSDGLVGMSVFEQKGTLDTGTLPRGGRATKVGGRHARVYETAAGRTIVWGAGDVVYSCVTDASPRMLGALVGKLPSQHRADVVARVTHFVLGPFSWD